ncbi:cobaltochelatase subunit CobN [Alkalilimnicola ehrlichii]|uniref:Cobaltochelatase subunit CobN n=2 Tax=Alkalilimnicola ehrlichii TaxID=351052 RepID=A0A3E0WNX4_9GAMM|nr:cobaltochelatase subunit CobN [Alkalilimnicola ehrlichii]RFA34674.1 cobaltochelatase subunit CobN [Alkalilimnicola ehrlichii]
MPAFATAVAGRHRFFSLLPALLLLACALLPLRAAAQAAEAPRMLVLSTEFVLDGKYRYLRKFAAEHGVALQQSYIERLTPDALQAQLANADLLLLDGPRASDGNRLEEALADLPALPPRLLVSAAGPHAAGLAEADVERLYAYFRNGGETNYRNLIRYVAAMHGGDRATVPAPIVFPSAGFYHPRLPERVVTDLEGYLDGLDREHGNLPLIGIVLHQSNIANGLTEPVDDLIARIEALGAQPLALYVSMVEHGELERLLMADGEPLADVLISFQPMYQATRLEEYRALGAPVLQAITWRSGDAAHWENDPVGIPTGNIPFYLAMPESAGVSDPLVVAAVKDGSTVAIPAQMQSMAQKAINLARLRRLDNADKRVAIFFYNYPPGERNLSASFLNVPRSLARVTAGLAAAGYDVSPLAEETVIEQGTALLRPFYRDDALDDLLERDLAVLLPLADYQRWFDNLPAKLSTEVTARWGEPEQDPMVIQRDGEAYFVVPRIETGKLVLLPQPPRGQRGEDAETAIYHDTAVPLNHFYMAAYLYVREQFGADALIHFGTHGSQEWTPGKERGLGIAEYPYLVLGDTPVIYPYIVDNLGESTQAKRRGRATIISHQTPPFRPAGLHRELMPVHDLIHEYELLDEGEVKAQTRQAILEAVAEDTLYKDLGWDLAAAATDFTAFERDLHDYLHELAQLAQPLGLHSFATTAKPTHRLSTVMQMLGEPFYALLDLEDLDELFVDDYQNFIASKPYAFLQRHLIDQAALPADTDPALANQLELARRHHAALAADGELAGLLAALAGDFVEPSYGGDPIRNPDSLPTGRNLYGFDPSKVPTRQAYTAGAAAIDELIANHHAAHGHYPQKLAFSMWSVETMRHLGVLEAQVFHALGVRPQWDRAGRISGIEVIPTAELGRPRVDVVVSATGLYRDQFPNVMGHIAAAVAAVAELDEPDNPLRTNAQRLAADLQARGYDAESAWELAVTRIFSSPTGSYGTGLDDATLASDSWEDESKLAELYLARMQYAFGPNPNHWGRKLDDLNLYAEQLKGVEAAVLSRSSNLYGMLTTDDPFQYLGGISLAARHVNGTSPELYISNLRDPSRSRYESAARFLAGELRSRQFHPGWIQALHAEGYAGTLEILGSVNNFWGWQVTDPAVVRDDQWQAFHDIYVEDKYELGMREWFEQHNPHALAQVIERLLEAARKDYWDADAATLASLSATYQELQQDHDVLPASSLLEPYLQTLASTGFGLGPGAAAVDAGASADAGAAAEPLVSGQQLTQVTPSSGEQSPLLLALLIALLSVFAAGGLRQALAQRRLRKA